MTPEPWHRLPTNGTNAAFSWCMGIRNDTITRIEFVGGPEDGRILELSDCPVMVTAEEAEDVGKVPMFLAMDNLEGFEEGDELELVILGHYVSHRAVGNCAKFDWIPFA